MAISVNDNLDVRAPKLTDRRNGPFASVEEALTAININSRKDGLPVIIGFGVNQVEHWFKDGQLVPKTGAGDGEDGSIFQIITPDNEGNLII